jgi:hypothetical protein
MLAAIFGVTYFTINRKRLQEEFWIECFTQRHREREGDEKSFFVSWLRLFFSGRCASGKLLLAFSDHGCGKCRCCRQAIVLRYIDVAYDGVVWPVNVPNITGISNIHVGQNIRRPSDTSIRESRATQPVQ